MAMRKVYSRAERIINGEIQNLKVTGQPGETIRESWADFIKNGGPRTTPQEYYKKHHPIRYQIKTLYDQVNNYIKGKLRFSEDNNSEDELITSFVH